MLQILINNYHIKPNSPKDLIQPLSLAIEGDHFEAVECLISLKADVNVVDSYGRSMLHFAGNCVLIIHKIQPFIKQDEETKFLHF